MRHRAAGGCETGEVARVKVMTEATGPKRGRRKGAVPPPPPPKKSAWRFWKWYLLLAVVVAGGLGLRLFLAPATDPVERADVVVVQLASGRGTLTTAIELMNRQVAPTLVIVDGVDPVLPTANKLCGGDAPFEVICPATPARSPREQARLLQTLAADRGWQRIALVAGETRLSRAALLAGRCTTAEIARVAAPDDGGVGAVATEAAGYLVALWLRRGC